MWAFVHGTWQQASVDPQFTSAMKVALSRSSMLRTVVIVIIVATLPGAIRKLIQTSSLYLFTERFFADMAARWSGQATTPVHGWWSRFCF